MAAHLFCPRPDTCSCSLCGQWHAAEKNVHFRLELLDGAVCGLKILVEPVTLGDEVLLPLAEAALLEFDLLGEFAAELLLLLFEARVVEHLDLGLAELARLHLLLPIALVVRLLRARDEVEHVRANQERPQLLEVAVVLVLHLGRAPDVVAAAYDAAVGRAHVLRAADHAERHRGHKRTRVLSVRAVDGVDGRREYGNVLCKDHFAYALLERGKVLRRERIRLCNHRDEVYPLREALHHLDVKRLQRVPSRRDEV